MNKRSRIAAMMLVSLIVMVFVSACATTKPQAQPGFTPGKYENAEYRFTVTFPDHYELQELQGDEVFKVANPNMYRIPVFSVNVAEAKPGQTLDAQAFVDSVSETMPKAKRFKILSEESIALSDGTPALAIFFKYLYSDGATKLQTASVWAIKDGKSFSTNATTILGGDTGPDKLMEVAKSLTFF
ncbi:hypothetical protein Dalk_0261 [Desulfatibacillum aliphaticivorans]|uniref:Lipoprotein n=1 Tax=Desulfatibacillum aliphaticivorans TaxID=218208 RepID=B8F8T8_DESAL|nr:hypothetical protein [Desulfatibacillum aliphaticivorans]ACL01970.1 hypothetical protein Dalk_0261 [Desulfatibacillum aliphaticivorans]